MKVHLGLIGREPHWDIPVEEFAQLAAIDKVGKHGLCDDPAKADVILFTQCHMLSRDWKLRAITQHPLAARFPDKVMVYDERDRPWCARPGVYASVPQQDFRRAYQRAWGYFRIPAVDSPGNPDLLFSLVASRSDPCRVPLFQLRHGDAVVEEVEKFTFYDPASPQYDERRENFRRTLSRSRFVLCPRGQGTSSIRLYETLAAGRVPVIISDTWVAPDGPDWDAFSIRWPEHQTDGLVATLEARLADWPQMSASARIAFDEFFAPETAFHHVARLCDDLRKAGAPQGFPSGGCRDGAFLRAGTFFYSGRMKSRARKVARRTLKRAPALRRLAQR